MSMMIPTLKEFLPIRPQARGRPMCVHSTAVGETNREGIHESGSNGFHQGGGLGRETENAQSQEEQFQLGWQEGTHDR